jgi:hypothetical protein
MAIIGTQRAARATVTSTEQVHGAFETVQHGTLYRVAYAQWGMEAEATFTSKSKAERFAREVAGKIVAADKFTDCKFVAAKL